MVVDLYEPQYLALIVFGGFVVLSFVVYAFSAFGIQEKSYEQAVAEQRARLEKEQLQQREVKRQKRKPFFEKKKGERQKPGILQQEVKRVPDQYVEEQVLPPQPPPAVKEEKVKVKSPKKPKQPKPPKPEVVEEPVFEAKQAPVQEVIPPSRVSQATKSKPPKVVEEQVQKREAPVVEATVIQAARQEQASPAKTRPKTKVTSDGDTQGLRGKSLISAVKSAPLKDVEIQQLIEILLNRQGGSASAAADDWVKANQRNDPVSALKKQLQEKEQSLHNEMLLAQSASQKVKELRQELTQHKEHSTNLEGYYNKQIETQAKEIKAYVLRIQQTHQTHALENQALQDRVKALQALVDDSQPGPMNQLREENKKLMAAHAKEHLMSQELVSKDQLMGQELARLQSELQKKQSELSANETQLRQGKEKRQALETQISQYQQQNTHFDAKQRENESALSKRLAEVSEELRKAEARNQSLVQTSSQETEKIKAQLAEVLRKDGDKNSTLQTIQAKLKESECQCQNLESQVRAVESRLAEREQQKSQADQELEALRKEKDSLQDMLQSLEKRSEAEGQEASPPLTDNTDSAPKEESISLEEHKNIVADKAKTIAGLEEQLSTRGSELTELQAVIEQQRQRNNNLREKNRKLMEVVSAAEKSSAENAKQAVQAVKEETGSAVTSEQDSTKQVLERLFPAVSIDSSKAHKEWVSDFEVKAVEVLSKLSSSNTQTDEYVLKITTLEAEKEQLSSQCQHYQSVLSDTEGMVNKLQASVETEEQRNRSRIQDLEKEKEEVSSRCKELQDRISSQGDKDSSDARRQAECVSRLEAEKKGLQEENESLRVEKEQLVSAKEELVATEERLGGRVQEVEKEKAQLAAQCQNYQVVLRETEGILNKLQSSVESEEIKWDEKLNQTEVNLGQAKSEVASLQDEITSLANTNSQKSDENSRLESDLEEARSTIEQLRQDQGAAASSYEATSHELDELKSNLHRLKEELEAANQRAEQSSDRDEENAETKSKLSASEADVKRLVGELQQAKSTLQDLQTRLQASSSQQEELGSLRKELETARSNAQEAQKASEEAQKEVGSLKEKLEAAPAGGNAELEKSVSELEKKVATQQKEVNTLNDNLKKEKALTLDLGKAAAKLQAMLKKTQSALTTERQTVEKLQKVTTNGAKEEPAPAQVQGSTSLTESQVELQLAEAASEETKQVDGTGV